MVHVKADGEPRFHRSAVPHWSKMSNFVSKFFFLTAHWPKQSYKLECQHLSAIYPLTKSCRLHPCQVQLFSEFSAEQGSVAQFNVKSAWRNMYAFNSMWKETSKNFFKPSSFLVKAVCEKFAKVGVLQSCLFWWSQISPPWILCTFSENTIFIIEETFTSRSDLRRVH